MIKFFIGFMYIALKVLRLSEKNDLSNRNINWLNKAYQYICDERWAFLEICDEGDFICNRISYVDNLLKIIDTMLNEDGFRKEMHA